MIIRKKSPRKHINKASWQEIDGQRLYFRSILEYEYACKLEFYRKAGAILKWEHEPETFWFEGIRRGCTNYKPDFKVYLADGTHYWVETKGYKDPKSATKIKRFKKYFPKEELRVITKI